MNHIFIFRKHWKQWILIITCLAAAFTIKYIAEPTFGPITIQFPDNEIEVGENPFFTDSKGDHFTAIAIINLPLLHSSKFYIKPDDCLSALNVNGKDVPMPDGEFCDYTNIGKKFDLSPYLVTGNNALIFNIRDDGGLAGLKITPAIGFGLAFSYLLLILVGFWIIYLLLKTTGKNRDHLLLLLLSFGILLRIIYGITTPYDTRSHDTDAHIEYITYVSEHFTVPPAAEGWEFHQAPLYYFVTGSGMRILRNAGMEYKGILEILKYFSVLISIATLLVGAGIATYLFPTKQDRWKRFAATGIFATFPSLLYLATRISNNGLYVFFGFLTIWQLLRWWQNEQQKDWYILCLFASLSMITRVSGLLLLVAIFLLFIWKYRKTFRQKLLPFFVGAVLVIIFTAWLPYIRFVVENDSNNSVTFGGGLNSELSVSKNPSLFFSFNPAQVLMNPYNEPWNKETRRAYFPEYFFKSAFFGEWKFPDGILPLSVTMLALSMIILVLMPVGFWTSFSRGSFYATPLAVITFITLAAHIWYRIHAPFSCNQDFRFSILLIIPLTFYALAAITSLKARRLLFAQSVFGAHIFLNTVFIVALVLT